MRLSVLAIALGLFCTASPILALGENSPASTTPGEVLPPHSDAKAAPMSAGQAAPRPQYSPDIQESEKAKAGPGLVGGPPAGTAQATSAGPVLTEGVKGLGAASGAGTTISNDAAAINYPTVDSAFASADGITAPIAADQNPGMERLTHPFAQSALFTGSGDVRVKRLIGTGVFNAGDSQLGTIQDVLLAPGSEPRVILEADGRKVEVPWSKLVFAHPGNELHGPVVLPGVTQHVLEQLPEFHPHH